MQSFAKIAYVAALAMIGAVEVEGQEVEIYTRPYEFRHKVDDKVINTVDVVTEEDDRLEMQQLTTF